ncbi:MAG: beta-ketoacyl-ACP synthase II [Candidatus Omnitrophota bacterium]|nr:beta-ketoacyl-ACP synthase II [Candidatus Omnitrophota bacterium]
MKKKQVAITGVGIISPIGNSKDEYWDSILKGKNGVTRLSYFDPSYFTSHIAAEVKNFDPSPYINQKKLRRMDKFVQFAVCASKMAVNDCKLDMEKEDRNRIGVYIGSGIGGLNTTEQAVIQYIKHGPEKGPSRITPFLIPMLIVNMASGMVSISLGLKGPSSAVATACATSNHAIGDAFRIIQRGEADIMIAGGSEGAITHMGFGGFCALRALSTRNNDPEHASRPFDKERDGFIMGEGAGVLILEELEHALRRKANIYSEIVGYAMTADAYHITAPDPKGDGATRCMRIAIEDAGIKPEDVDYINAHGTSTQLNDKIETAAIRKAFGKHAYKLAVSSTKSMVGHMLGAAGGAELIATVLGIKEGIIPPTTNLEVPDPECDLDYVPGMPRKKEINIALSNALGFGGHNATLVVRKHRS